MSRRLLEIAGLFLKLGSIGFGGPATHLALMEDEVVERRGWLSRQHFLDLVGATNLIPGPNSTEMAIHIGFVRGGWAGLVVAGTAFILPAVLITTALAWLYVEHGRQPQVEPIIAGIKPAVLAVIFTAGWRLGRKALNGWIVGTVFAAAAIASLCRAGEITVLLACSLIGMLWLCWYRHRRDKLEPTNGLGLGAVLLAGTAGSSAARRQAGDRGVAGGGSSGHGVDRSDAGAIGLVLLESRRRPVWHRLRVDRVPAGRPGPRVWLVERRTTAGCHRHRPIHAGAHSVHGHIHRLSL